MVDPIVIGEMGSRDMWGKPAPRVMNKTEFGALK
jgi:hypothetical protein